MGFKVSMIHEKSSEDLLYVKSRSEELYTVSLGSRLQVLILLKKTEHVQAKKYQTVCTLQ